MHIAENVELICKRQLWYLFVFEHIFRKLYFQTSFLIRDIIGIHNWFIYSLSQGNTPLQSSLKGQCHGILTFGFLQQKTFFVAIRGRLVGTIGEFIIFFLMLDELFDQEKSLGVRFTVHFDSPVSPIASCKKTEPKNLEALSLLTIFDQRATRYELTAVSCKKLCMKHA